MPVTVQQVQTASNMIFDYLERWKGSDLDVAVPDGQWEHEAYPDPFGLGLGYVRLYLVAARHQLLGASHLLTSGAFWGEDILVRASVEAAASAYHIASRWENPEEFIKESVVDRVWSLEERRKLLDGAEDPGAIEDHKRTVELASAATKFGASRQYWTEEHRSSEVAGRRELVRRCKSLFAATPEMNGNPGVFYRYFSGAAHSNPSLMISRGQTTPVGTSVRFQPSPKELMIAISAGVFGLETASRAVSAMTFEALDSQPFDVFRTLASQVME